MIKIIRSEFAMKLSGLGSLYGCISCFSSLEIDTKFFCLSDVPSFMQWGSILSFIIISSFSFIYIVQVGEVSKLGIFERETSRDKFLMALELEKRRLWLLSL